MDYHNLCPGCFTDSSGQEPCLTCGYSPDSNPGAGLYLTPGTLLFNKYLVGRILGQGGFGITYLGWDTNLDIRIAIKEFFPQGLVSRLPGENSVVSYTGEIKDQFSFGVESFLRESKTLARFEHHPNIVSVRDFFKENNTAYMVMSFIEGITLLEHLNRSGGRIPLEQAVQIIMPVLDALREVHRAGIMHRDISPDNIFIDREGRIVLIDFGAARQEMREKSKSLSVILKAGYAPPEQYQSRGKQGPWTDIYAVAATLYRAITGETPLEAIDRMAQDDLQSPSQLGVKIDEPLEKTLLKALSVKTEYRYQTVEEFQAALLNSEADKKVSRAKEVYTGVGVVQPVDRGERKQNMPENISPKIEKETDRREKEGSASDSLSFAIKKKTISYTLAAMLIGLLLLFGVFGLTWHGTKTYYDGSEYVGIFKNFKRHGQGTYTYPSGNVYVGEWKNDKRHGQGTMTYFNGVVKKGIWEYDEFLGQWRFP